MGYSYNPKSLCADEFINDEEILETLAFADAHKDDVQLCYDILEKCCRGCLGARMLSIGYELVVDRGDMAPLPET